MEIIYIDKVISKDSLKIFFKKLFSDLDIFYCGIDFNLPKKYNKKNNRHILCVLDEEDERIEYKLNLTLYIKEEDEGDRELYIAQQISVFFEANTMVATGLFPGAEDLVEPAIVFINGQPYMAEIDENSYREDGKEVVYHFYGENGKKWVKVISPLDMKIPKFNSKGIKIR